MYTQNILYKNHDFFMKIHDSTSTRLENLKSVTALPIEDFSSDFTLKQVTQVFMKRLNKSDSNFLIWLHYVGHYLKIKYDGKWGLIKRKKIAEAGTFLSPIIINKAEDVWLVGDFCYDLYFRWNRMKGMSYSSFYKGSIERIAFAPKFEDLNIDREDLIILEQ